MAHFIYPLRPATGPEVWAFAYPERERGVLKARLDTPGMDLGARLVAKVPFYVGDFLVGMYEEFVIVDKAKSGNWFKFRSIRDPRIVLEATAEEIDASFYLTPGEERGAKYAPAYPLTGKPSKMIEG